MRARLFYCVCSSVFKKEREEKFCKKDRVEKQRLTSLIAGEILGWSQICQAHTEKAGLWPNYLSAPNTHTKIDTSRSRKVRYVLVIFQVWAIAKLSKKETKCFVFLEESLWVNDRILQVISVFLSWALLEITTWNFTFLTAPQNFWRLVLISLAVNVREMSLKKKFLEGFTRPSRATSSACKASSKHLSKLVSTKPCVSTEQIQIPFYNHYPLHNTV